MVGLRYKRHFLYWHGHLRLKLLHLHQRAKRQRHEVAGGGQAGHGIPQQQRYADPSDLLALGRQQPVGSIHRPLRQLQCDAEHHRPCCPYRDRFCFGHYRKRLQNLCELHLNSGYLAVQHQRRLYMDDLLYDGIHQCQRNVVLAFAEHKLHGEGAHGGSTIKYTAPPAAPR